MGGAEAIRVVVTRPREQSRELIRLLTEAGYAPVSLPLLDIQPLPVPDDDWESFAMADVVAVTSPTGAHHLVARLAESGRTVPEGMRVAAVGRETGAVLRAAGIAVHVVPSRATGVALADALAAEGVEGRHIVLARAREGRVELADGLRAAGARVTELPLYESVDAAVDPAEVVVACGAEVWIVTSPKIVEAAVNIVGREHLRGTTVVSIGPTTSARARDLGVPVAAEAAEQSASGLVAALIGL